VGLYAPAYPITGVSDFKESIPLYHQIVSEVICSLKALRIYKPVTFNTNSSFLTVPIFMFGPFDWLFRNDPLDSLF